MFIREYTTSYVVKSNLMNLIDKIVVLIIIVLLTADEKPTVAKITSTVTAFIFFSVL
jgi:hypothetical protein